MRNSEPIGFIISAMTSGWGLPDICTAMCGPSTTGQYLKGMSYTTKMATLSTMIFPTSPASRSAHIRSCINQQSGSAMGARSTLPVLDHLLLNGTGQPQAVNGTESTGVGLQQIGRRATRSVPVAEWNFRRSSLSQSIVRSVVQIRVGRPVSVYNVSVQDVPEYFANGFLVHNCDAAAAALGELTRTRSMFIG